jgi:hypothetical protein
MKTKTPQQCSYRYKKIYTEKNLKKWTRYEDILIVEMLEKYDFNWNKIKNHFPFRKKQEIKDRYYSKLDPNLNLKFESEDDDLIIKLHKKYGNKWSHIKKYFKDKSAPMIKYRYYYIKKNSEKQHISYSNSENNISEIKVENSADANYSINKKENHNQNQSQNIISNIKINNSNMNIELEANNYGFNYSLESEINNKKLNNSTKTRNKLKANNSFIFNKKDYSKKYIRHSVINNDRKIIRLNKRHSLNNNKRKNNNYIFANKENNKNFNLKDDKNKSNYSFIFSIPKDLNIINNNTKFKTNINQSNSDEISLSFYNNSYNNNNKELKESIRSFWDDNSIIDTSVFENDFDFEEFIQDFDKIEKELNIQNNNINNNINNINLNNHSNLIDNIFNYQNYSDININLLEDDIFNFHSLNKSQNTDATNSSKRFSNYSNLTNDEIYLNRNNTYINKTNYKLREYSDKDNLTSGFFDNNIRINNDKHRSMNDLKYYSPFKCQKKEHFSENEIKNLDSEDYFNWIYNNKSLDYKKKEEDFVENYNKIFNPNSYFLDNKMLKIYDYNDFNQMRLDKENKKEEEINISKNNFNINECDKVLLEKFKILESIYNKYRRFELNKFSLKNKINNDKKKGRGKSEEENLIYLEEENEFNKENEILKKNLFLKKKEFDQEMKINDKSEKRIYNMRNLIIQQTDILIKLIKNMKMKIDLIKRYG